MSIGGRDVLHRPQAKEERQETSEGDVALARWIGYREEGELDFVRRMAILHGPSFDLYLDKDGRDKVVSIPIEHMRITTTFECQLAEIQLEFNCCDDKETYEFIEALIHTTSNEQKKNKEKTENAHPAAKDSAQRSNGKRSTTSIACGLPDIAAEGEGAVVF